MVDTTPAITQMVNETRFGLMPETRDKSGLAEVA